MADEQEAPKVEETKVPAGMVEKVGKAVAEKAYGKPLKSYKGLNLPASLEYKFKYLQYTNDAAGIAAMIAAKDEMTLEEQLKARNADKLNNARAKEREAEFTRLKIVKPTAENDLSIAYKDMLKTLKAVKLPDGSRKFTDEQAHTQAVMLSGFDPNTPAEEVTEETTDSNGDSDTDSE